MVHSVQVVVSLSRSQLQFRHLPTKTFLFHLDKYSGCIECPKTFTEGGLRPTKETFDKYFMFFLTDFASEDCAKSGRASYSEAISYVFDDNGNAVVRDSFFMGYHTPSVGSKDFYTSLRQAKRIASDVREMLSENGYDDVVFFPYR